MQSLLFISSLVILIAAEDIYSILGIPKDSPAVFPKAPIQLSVPWVGLTIRIHVYDILEAVRGRSVQVSEALDFVYRGGG